MKTTPDIVAARLRSYRAFADKTQEEVAAEIGVSTPTIVRWESGEAMRMSLDKAFALAELYNTTLDQLTAYELDRAD